MSSSNTFRSWARDRVKPLEVFGRHVLQWVIAFVLSVRQRPISPPRKVLVVRLDKRVGNLLLLTPFLRSLREGVPGVHITVLCHEAMARVLSQNPLIDAIELYTKWNFFTRKGIPAMLVRLRAQRFDVAFDAGSFFGAAVTHPLITRLSGARRFVGPHRAPMWRIYHVAVPVLPESASDIDQRLQLLNALPSVPRVREMCFMAPGTLNSLADTHRAFLQNAAPAGLDKTIACVVGARLAERRVAPAVWAEILQTLHARGFATTLVWGPDERTLAEAVCALVPGTVLAPPSTLEQAAILFNRCAGVVGHDTGTSHLAVAVGAATFVMFLTEAPSRYGHVGPRRMCIDLRDGVVASQIVGATQVWVDQLLS